MAPTVLTRRQAALIGLAVLPFCVQAGAGRVKDRVDIATDKAAAFILKMQDLVALMLLLLLV